MGPASRFATWPRWAAAAVLALTLLLSLAALLPATGGRGGTAPKLNQSAAEQSDLDLYRAIIARVAAGEDYYPVAAEELRKGGYPLRPFFTFRLPTQAHAYALVGERAMIVPQALLALAVLVLWWRRVRASWPPVTAAVFAFLLAAGLGALVEPVTGLFHESWAAMLLALAVLWRGSDRWPLAVLCGALALLIRELALPMALALLGLALVEKRWKEAAGWAAALALFVAYWAWHAAQVAAVVTPADPASPGWSSLGGLFFTLKSFQMVTAATIVPYAIAAPLFLLSLLGWASRPERFGLAAAMLLAGYGAMLFLFARPDTFYWALIAAPLSLAGATFAPRAISDLTNVLLRRQEPSKAPHPTRSP